MWQKASVLLPIIAASLVINFMGAVRVVAISTAFGFLFEYLFSKIYARKFSILDGSTFLNSLLFACHTRVPFRQIAV